MAESTLEFLEVQWTLQKFLWQWIRLNTLEVDMNKVKFSYVRNPKRKRDVTIVSNIFFVNEKPFVEFGYAFRSNHDTFKKVEGRRFATERMALRDPKFSGIIEIQEIRHKKIMAGILKEILENKDIPLKFVDDLQASLNFYLME